MALPAPHSQRAGAQVVQPRVGWRRPGMGHSRDRELRMMRKVKKCLLTGDRMTSIVHRVSAIKKPKERIVKSLATALFIGLLTAATASAQCSWVNQTSSVVETCGSIGIGTTTPT